MSAVIGLWQRDGAPLAADWAGPMLAAGAARAVQGQAVWQAGSVGLAHLHFDPYRPAEAAQQPLSHPTLPVAVTADSRLDDTEALAGRLDLPVGASDAALILAAYLRWGRDCPAYLDGDFACLIWDGRQRELFLARDRLGVRDLAYYVDRRLCLAASEVSAILSHPAVPRRISAAKIGAYLANVWRDQALTFYEGILYCPPAHAGVVTPHGCRVWRYWDFDPDRRVRYRQESAYAEHLGALLDDAVTRRLPPGGVVGVSLSGGPDSATVAALAARQLPRARLKSFSYIFDHYPAADERAYIHSLAARYDLDAVYIAGDDRWPLRHPATWPVLPDFAGQDPFVRLPLAVMQAAQAVGCRVLLSGHFGDLLFAGGEFWVASLLHEYAWGELRRQMGQVDGRRAALLADGLRQLLPRRLKMAYRRRRPRPWPAALLGQLAPQLAQRADLAAAWQASPRQRDFPAPTQWERYQYLTGSGDPQGMAAARRLYNQHGLELVDPLWDRALIAFALAVPAHLLGRAGVTKWVLRQAAADWLPPAILNRRDKASLYELFKTGLLDKEAVAVRRLTTEARCVAHGYINPAWLAAQVAAGAGWSAYGFPLWQTLALEMWLRQEEQAG